MNAEAVIGSNYSVFDHLLEGCRVIDYNWRYVYINDAASRHARTTKEAFAGKTFTDLFPEIKDSAFFRLLQDCMVNRHVHHVENKHVFADGTPGWFEIRMQPVPEGVFLLSLDITARKLAQLKERENEARLSTIFHNSPLGIVMTRLHDGKIVDVNDAFANLHGYAIGELIGKTSSELKLWQMPFERDMMIQRLIEEKTVKGMEIVSRKKNGEIFDLRISVELLEQDGELFTIGIGQDITNERKAGRTIKVIEEQFDLAFLSSPTPQNITIISTGEIVAVNHAFCSLFGFKPEELLGSTTLKLNMWENPKDREVALEKLHTQGFLRMHETNIQLSSGEIRTVLVSFEKITWKNSPCVISSILDITEHKQAENALRESENKFRKIYEEGPFGMVLVNKQFKFISANTTFCRMMGYTEIELQQLAFKDITYPEDVSNNILHVQKLIQGEIPAYKTEKRYVRKDGQVIWGALTVTANFSINGQFNYNVAIIEDITARKQTEAIISKITERLELATHASGIGIWDWDILSNQLVWDKQMYQLYGFKEGTFPEVYEAWLNGLHPDDRECSHAITQQALKGGKEYNTAFRVVWPDKSVHWLKASGQVFFDANHTPVRMVGVNYDITEQKNLEIELQQKNEEIEAQNEEYRQINEELFKAKEAALESEKTLQAAIESITDAVFISDAEGRFVKFNDAFATFHKFKDKEECAKTLQEYPAFLEVYMLNGEQAPLEQWAVSRALRGEKVLNAEYTLRRSDTGETWVGSYSFAPILDQYGTIIGSVVVGRDITEQKQAELELRLSEEKFSKAFMSSVAALIVTRLEDGTFIDMNEEYCKIIGYTRAELLGKKATDFNILRPPGDRKAIIEKLSDKGFIRDLEFQVISRSGEIKDVIASQRMIDFQNEKTINTSMYDITERKRNELLLKEKTEEIEAQNEEYLQINEELYQTNQELHDAKDRIEKSEEKFRKVFLTNPDAVTITRLKDGRYTQVNNGFTRILEYAENEIVGKTSVELNIWHEVSNRKQFVDILQTNGLVENFEAQFNTKSGRVFDGLVSSVVIKLEGEPHILSITRDISFRKKYEKDLMEAKEKAEKSDRLKTSFLQNMSHEIRTPMNAIMGFSDLLMQNSDNKPKLKKFVEVIKQRSNDLLDIINEILDVAKIESGHLPVNIEDCRLSSLFHDIGTFFSEFQKKQNKQHLTFTTYLPGKGATITILTDKVKLKQIFINLIGNAFKFTDKGEIKTGCMFNEENKLIFYVSDTGIGIPLDKQEFIFERFAQLEATPDHLYGGTGLGLSIVKGLLDLLGGKVWLESEVGKGSTFYFSIPYEVVSTSAEHSVPKKQDEYDFSNKTVLIVEDDLSNGYLIAELMKQTGIKAINAYTGAEAIQIAKSHKLDIVLMDIRLPDMDGYTATQVIRKFKPELTIIAQTAYAAQEDKEKAIHAGCNDYISKPINKELLFPMMEKHLSR